MAQVEDALKLVARRADPASVNQMGLFGAMAPALRAASRGPIAPWDLKELLRNEKEALGFYVTAHPLDKYTAEISRLSGVTTQDLAGAPDGSQVVLVGVVQSVKLKNNKAGKRYATFSLEDLNGAVEVIAWPETYQKTEAAINSDEPVVARGKLDIDEERAQILLDDLKPLSVVMVDSVREVHIRAPKTRFDEGSLANLKALFGRHWGGCPIYLHLELDQAREAIFLLGNDFRVAPTEVFVGEIEQMFAPGAVRIKGSTGGRESDIIGHSLTRENNHWRPIKQLTPDRERAILVGVAFGNVDRMAAENSLEELGALAQSAGAEVAGELFQNLKEVDPRTFIGRGKVAELRDLAHERGATLTIFDESLAPAQARNLENELKLRVIDRTQLILDIFAQRAHSLAGKLQVEVAQLAYLQPRLTRQWTHLVAPDRRRRVGGGRIGTRGPGETQLEVDRRRLAERLTRLAPAPAGSRADARHPAPPAHGGAVSDRRAGGLHQLRQIHADECPDRRRRGSRRAPVFDPRSDYPAAQAARRDECDGERHGGLYPSAAPSAGRGFQGHPGGGADRRFAAACGG